MKKVTQSSSSVVLFASIVFLAYFAAKPYTGGVIDHHKVGDIIYSILPPDKFKALHGEGWNLLDGSRLKESDDLNKIYGWSKLPDASGRFLRGLNFDYYLGVDPERERKVGSLQDDALAKHRHEWIAELEEVEDGSGNRVEGGDGDGGTINMKATRYTEYFGESETRPKNVALYIYIKVDER